MDNTFRISHLADLYGLNTDTIRYYESLGLLHPARRENGYREFTMADLVDTGHRSICRQADDREDLIGGVSHAECCQQLRCIGRIMNGIVADLRLSNQLAFHDID